MKRSTSKKKLILPVVAVTSLALSSLALAGTTPPVGSSHNLNNKGIVSAINKLGKKMVALTLAGVTAVDNAMFQFDKNLLDSLKANTASTRIASKVGQNTDTATNQFIKKSFQIIPNSILSTSEGMINAKTIQKQIKTRNNLVNTLTLGVPGSDTLYSNNLSVIESQYTNGSNYYIGPPKTNDDNYFNVASILEPMTYTKDQLTASHAYMDYLTKNYKNPVFSLHLSILQAKLNAEKPTEQYNTLYNFISSTPYQKYQLALRSSMASRSIAVNNFNRLIAERTPSKKSVSGIHNRQGKEITHPSPLQVKSYIASHRVNNPKWIESLQSQSSTTLQRETVVLLAEIEHQNYQAHLDRERVLATLSAMQLQGSTASRMLLQTKAAAVNQEIKAIGETDSDSMQSTTNSNDQTDMEIIKEKSKINNPAKKKD